MAGRPPKATKLHVLHGTGRNARMEKRKSEPEFTAASVEPPKGMKGEALKEWKFIAPRLLAAGVLTEVDRTALEMYCNLAAHCRKEFKRGNVPTGNMLAQLRGLAASFGLDPSSRTRISVIPKDKKDPMEAFLNGAKK